MPPLKGGGTAELSGSGQGGGSSDVWVVGWSLLVLERSQGRASSHAAPGDARLCVEQSLTQGPHGVSGGQPD